jgi:hypothetical protein
VDNGFVVRSGEDRFSAPIRFLNGRFDVKVSGRDTGGRLCVVDTVRIAPGGPPVHVHAAQDEVFHVLDGRFRFLIGTSWSRRDRAMSSSARVAFHMRLLPCRRLHGWC